MKRLFNDKACIRRMLAALAIVVAGVTAIGFGDPASAAESSTTAAPAKCYWLANQMGRASNCDGRYFYDIPCDMSGNPVRSVDIWTYAGEHLATAEMYYSAGCRTVDAYLSTSTGAQCYVKLARTQSGGGEAAVRSGPGFTQMLYASGREAYIWVHCTYHGKSYSGGSARYYTPPA